MCVPVIISVQGGKGLIALDVSAGGDVTVAISWSALASRTISRAWIGLLKAFALENVDVIVGHVIQRCHRIETHQSELLGDGVSISRNALDGEVLDPCEDEGRLCWVGFKPCR